MPPHVSVQFTPFSCAESNFSRKIKRFQKKDYLNPINRSKVMQFLRLDLFAKFAKVKNSRKSGVKSNFSKGHFHANWAIAKLFQNFEKYFWCLLMCGSNLLWYIPPTRHFTKTRYCRVKSHDTWHFTLKFRVKYGTYQKAKIWIPLSPRGGYVPQ